MAQFLRIFIFIILLVLNFNEINAQQWKLLRYEVQGGVSSCNYFGDIGGSASSDNLYGLKDMQLFSTRPSLYFGARYYLLKKLAIQGNLNIGAIHGSDLNSKNDYRGYVFSTFFIQPRLNFEFSLIKVNDLFGRKKLSFMSFSKSLNKTFDLYAYGGVGYSFYKVSINDKMENFKARTDTLINPQYFIDLKRKHALTANFGIGVRYFFIQQVAFFTSIDYNFVNTDNFDGFSTITKVPDLYWMTTFGLSYRIPTNEWGKISFVKKKKTEKPQKRRKRKSNKKVEF